MLLVFLVLCAAPAGAIAWGFYWVNRCEKQAKKRRDHLVHGNSTEVATLESSSTKQELEESDDVAYFRNLINSPSRFTESTPLESTNDVVGGETPSNGSAEFEVKATIHETFEDKQGLQQCT